MENIDISQGWIIDPMCGEAIREIKYRLPDKTWTKTVFERRKLTADDMASIMDQMKANGDAAGS